MQCFELEDGVLSINYEPVNDIEELAEMCLRLVAESHGHEIVIVRVNQEVEALKSCHVGVLLSCAVLASHSGKKLELECSEQFKRYLKMVDGQKLLDLTNAELD